MPGSGGGALRVVLGDQCSRTLSALRDLDPATDVVLPRVSGPSLAQRLNDFKPDACVLFMSGYSEESALLRNLLGRNAAFLPKPFTPQALAIKVREVLDSVPKQAPSESPTGG